MLQPSEESDFSQDTLAIDVVVEDSVHLLDGDLLTGGLVDGGGHLAVGASAEELDQFVVIADFPVLELLQTESFA